MRPDPTPWRHVDGTRVADPRAPDSPTGGYTYEPRHGYSDHDERYRSTRYRDSCRTCDLPARHTPTQHDDTKENQR